MVEVPPEGLYGFKDFSQVIKAIADIKLIQAELLKQSQRIEELEKDIDSISDKSEKQADNIDRIWGMMGRVTARSQELEDHITGEDTQLKSDEYDVEEMV